MKSKLKETKSRMFLLKLEENGIDSSKKHLEIPPQRLRNILEIEKDQLEDWINSQGNQKTLQFKDKINNECLLNIVNSCQKLKMEQNNVTFYKHPMIQQRDLKDQSILKTLVVIGETGVGKSTMINFSAITILDSNMQIHLDLQLLMKNKYNNYIKGLDGNSAVRIIDTPGFGATRGYEEDEKISNLITAKLQDLDSITLICFVMKATTIRLYIQKYLLIDKKQLFLSINKSELKMQPLFSNRKCILDETEWISNKRISFILSFGVFNPGYTLQYTNCEIVDLRTLYQVISYLICSYQVTIINCLNIKQNLIMNLCLSNQYYIKYLYHRLNRI